MEGNCDNPIEREQKDENNQAAAFLFLITELVSPRPRNTSVPRTVAACYRRRYRHLTEIPDSRRDRYRQVWQMFGLSYAFVHCALTCE